VLITWVTVLFSVSVRESDYCNLSTVVHLCCEHSTQTEGIAFSNRFRIRFALTITISYADNLGNRK